jgi:molybdenum cofactor synthesis domain-containing protein
VSSGGDVTAALIVIGDEILSGRTKDKNIGTLADHLTGIGIRLREVRIVADDEADIVAAVNSLRTHHTYVFTTGGIGPTHDDITADSIAKAFRVPIDVDPRAREVLQEACNARGVELTPARLRMARLPQGAALIETSISVAPGFMMDNVIVMAGIPEIMRNMMEAVTPHLRTGAKMLSETIALEQPESQIADLFAAHQKSFPDIAMGSYPHLKDGKPATDLVLRGTDPGRLIEARDALLSLLSRVA